MKILVLLEFGPGTSARKRSAFNTAMIDSGFLRLPGVSSAWVADRKFTGVTFAADALAKSALIAEAPIHKSYLVEYGEFAVFAS